MSKVKIPTKKRLRSMADQMWSSAIRGDWASKCAVCGNAKCEAHHLVPRHHEATRYEVENGIALCAYHHKFDKDISPHQNAYGWMEWLESNEERVWKWYKQTVDEGWHRNFDGTKTTDYYIGIIQSLREYVEDDDFVRICGKRFSAWLCEQNTEG